MALLNAGWFQTTWFPSRWWQEDWWLEYGTALPPPPPAPIVITSTLPPRRRIRKAKPLLSYRLLVSVREYLEMKLRSEDND